jgi:hypothetical protein
VVLLRGRKKRFALPFLPLSDAARQLVTRCADYCGLRSRCPQARPNLAAGKEVKHQIYFLHPSAASYEAAFLILKKNF